MEGSETAVLELLRERFASLDARLDRQDRTLGEIHEEAKRTNGRVGTLERWRGEQEAVSKRVRQIEGERAFEKDEAEKERRDRRWKAFEVAAGSLTVILAALLPLLITGVI